MTCFVLFMHETASARPLALANAGNNIAARMAMMAMTTSNSINVKADRVFRQAARAIGGFILLSSPPPQRGLRSLKDAGLGAGLAVCM
jgi:hypothetical protein